MLNGVPYNGFQISFVNATACYRPDYTVVMCCMRILSPLRVFRLKSMR